MYKQLILLLETILNSKRSYKFIFVLFLLVFVSRVCPGVEIVINEDKPLKGKWEHKLTRVWEIDSAGKDVFVNIGAINVDGEGNVYCVDRKHKKIYVFNSNGKFLFTIGRNGEGPGEYVNLYNIYLKNNLVIVPDNGRFHYYKKNGKYIETKQSGIGFVFPGDFINKDVFVNQKPKKGFVFKIDLFNIHNIKTNQSINLCEITLPKPVVAGTMRHIKTEIICTGDQFVLHGERKKYLVKKFDISGKKVLEFSINGRLRNKVSKKTLRKKWALKRYRGGLMPKNMVDQAVKNEPEYAPFFKGINVYKDLIFVLLDDPDKEPLLKMDIFSASGEYIYSSMMAFPKDITLKSIPIFKEDFIYVFAEGRDGEGKLIKFKTNFPGK